MNQMSALQQSVTSDKLTPLVEVGITGKTISVDVDVTPKKYDMGRLQLYCYRSILLGYICLIISQYSCSPFYNRRKITEM